MGTLLTDIQAVNMAGLVAILLASIIAWRRWPDSRGLVVPPLLWSGYGVVFYSFALTGRLSNDGLLIWGAIHRMLAVFMILGAMVALWFIMESPDNDNDGTG